MTQRPLSLMSRWWTAATWRRSWSMDWHGSGRLERIVYSISLSLHGLSKSLPPPSPLLVFFSSFLFNSQLLNHKFSSQKSPFPFSLQDVQLKVKAYILGTDMSNFKYDDFIVVLDVISRYAAGVRGANSSLSSLIGLHYLFCCCSFLLLVFFSLVFQVDLISHAASFFSLFVFHNTHFLSNFIHTQIMQTHLDTKTHPLPCPTMSKPI